MAPRLDMARCPGLCRGSLRPVLRTDDSRRDAAVYGAAHIILVGGEEQVRMEGLQIGGKRSAAHQHRARYVQAVMRDGVEYPKRAVRAVAGHDDDLHQILSLPVFVELQQGPDQAEARPGL